MGVLSLSLRRGLVHWGPGKIGGPFIVYMRLGRVKRRSKKREDA